MSISITKLPPLINARATLFESASKLIKPDSEIIWEGIFALAEITSSPLPDISTENEEFLASSLINIFSPPGLLPVTSTIIFPGRVSPERSSIADSCESIFIGPWIVVTPPLISDPSDLLNFTSISPRGMTRLFIIVIESEPELNVASEKSLKLKLFVVGSKLKNGILT